MSLLENTKKILEGFTGFLKPDKNELPFLVRKRKPHFYFFKNDGKTPNHPYLPLIHYHTPVKLIPPYDPAAIFEVLFATNDWKHSWRDGVYPFLHFHTHTHEVLGIARGHVRVEFGGQKGKIIELKAGDVVILPAGTGHRQRSASRDLLVVGAYPANGGVYDEPKPQEILQETAIQSIAQVELPKKDPVYGKGGGLLNLWRNR